jgi:hypothetical protein
VNFLQLPNETWGQFFNSMTEMMRGRLVELDVIGLDLGALVAAEWLPLAGISYVPADETLYVITDAPAMEHAIPHPRQIFVDLGAAGVSQVVVIDADDRRHFVRLRTPLELPAASELFDQDAAASPHG